MSYCDKINQVVIVNKTNQVSLSSTHELRQDYLFTFLMNYYYYLISGGKLGWLREHEFHCLWCVGLAVTIIPCCSCC